MAKTIADFGHPGARDHGTMLDHHISAVPAYVTESLYEKEKRDWAHHSQSLSFEGENSTELVAVAVESLTCASQLHLGWMLHKRGASLQFSQKVCYEDRCNV